MTVHESILANVKAQLTAIVAGASSTGGHTFNYTPSVARVDDYRHEYLDKVKNPDHPLYLVRDTGEETEVEPERFGDLGRAVSFPILLCKQDRRAETNPFKTSTDAGTVRNEMIDDTLAKLAEDDNRGQGDSIVINTEFPRVVRDFYKEGWILAELWVLVTFRFPRDAP